MLVLLMSVVAILDCALYGAVSLEDGLEGNQVTSSFAFC